MKPWREIATPHRDVLEGTMLQAAFAVDLHAVRAGKAPPGYQDPRAFFERTFITAGMRQLLTEVVRRLGGQGGEPVVQLQTGFGGGKTHTMLAVYHLATRTLAPREMAGVSRILDEAGVADSPAARVAVLDGNRSSPGQPWKVERHTVHTLWGDLAWQLAGAEGYALVKEADRSGTSPGKGALDELLELAGPSVILVDELVAYVRQFSGDAALSGGTFASNLSFMQALTEAVKTAPQAMLLASLPESEVEVGGDRGVEALRALEKIFGRVQAVWRPVGTEESFEIVRMRLFEPIVHAAERRAVSQAFAEAYRAEGARVPAETQEARYAERLEIAYPIHPEVFDRLFEDWSTLEKFQRTRGVLKLMARVIHRLWRDGNTDAMILPASLPLHDRDASSELTAYLPQGWEAVLERDIDGPKAESTELDTKDPRFGSAQAARRVSRAIFLGSAPSSAAARPGLRGIDKARVVLGCLEPGQNGALYLDALGRLGDRLHYLNSNSDGAGSGANTFYWFDTRANLRREMEDRRGRFRELPDVRAHLETAMKRILGRPFDYVHIFAPHADVPDDGELRFVVLPPSERYEKPIQEGRGKRPEADLDKASQAALTALRWNGTRPRTHGNRLLFLAADHVTYERLSGAVKTHLAWASIVEDIAAGRLNVDRHQENSAKKQSETAAGVVDQTARECFKWLLCPLQEDPAEPPRMEAFPLKTTGTPLRDEVLRACREQELVIETWAPIHLRGVLASYYWQNGKTHAGARQVWDDTTKYLYLPRLRHFQAFEQVVRSGAAAEDFFALAQGQEGERYLGLTIGAAPTQVDASTLLVKPDAARAQHERERLARDAAEEARAVESAGAVRTPSDEVTPLPDPVGGTTPNPTKPARAGSQPRVQAAEARRITHFFASKDLPGASAKYAFSEIFAAIVQPLTAVSTAQVRVTVNIEADLPEGVSADVRAAIEKALADHGVGSGGFE
jgi:predicted AAA+ superfamily ATPase